VGKTDAQGPWTATCVSAHASPEVIAVPRSLLNGTTSQRWRAVCGGNPSTIVGGVVFRVQVVCVDSCSDFLCLRHAYVIGFW